MDNHSELFKFGREYFHTAITELRQQKVMVSPALELCAAEDLLCYYHLGHQAIYLSLPDRETPQGKLQMLLLRSLLACDSNEEVLRLLSLSLNWLVVHEIAHHLRHHYGLLSINIWQEEQIANQLALAISKPRFSSTERIECHRLLTRATNNLALKLEAGSSITNSYHNLAHGLSAAGLILPRTLRHIKHLEHYPGLLCETILKHRLVEAPPDIDQRIHNRHQIIVRLNAASKQSVVRHLYYYFGWMDIGLMSDETSTIQEFAERYLNHNQERATV